MVVGYDCLVDKSVCKLGYPNNCNACISKKFSELNLLMDIMEVTEQSSDRTRKEMLYKTIYRKYQDILNIRHIILLTKTGLPAFNMPVMDMPIDASLISGFIQANVAFSSEKLTMIDQNNPEKEFYEFEYKNFRVLLKNGKLSRSCLILDKKPSNELKELLSNFTTVFEDLHGEDMQKFEQTGDLSLLDPAKSLIEKIFEVSIRYPLTLSSKIPMSTIENLTPVQQALYEYSKELSKGDNIFFVDTLIDSTIKLIGVVPKEEAFWHFYQLLRDNIIVTKKLDSNNLPSNAVEDQKQKQEKVMQVFKNSKALDEIFFECGKMKKEEAEIKINSILTKAERAEKDAAYQEALNEYQKALTYAKEFNIQYVIDKVPFKIVQLTDLNKKVELDFALEQANKFEKKRNFVLALKYLFQTQNLLTAENPDGNHDKDLKRLENRIKKIQSYFKQQL